MLISETILNNAVVKLPTTEPQFEKLRESTEELVSKKISPTKQISELIGQALLEEWVRQGIDKHRGIRNSCGFCGQPLPNDLWERLDNHFNKESEELREEIIQHIDHLTTATSRIESFIAFPKEQFYSSFHNRVSALEEEWLILSSAYKQNLEQLIKTLEIRKADIFTPLQLPIINNVSEQIVEFVIKFNDLVEENSQKTSTLQIDQQQARKELRYSELVGFIRDIDYIQIKKDQEQQEIQLGQESQKIQDSLSEIASLIEAKRVKEAEANDESKGAELVNQHLSRFFGHDELKLVAEGVSPQTKFKITRGDGDAKNLSEGECSLISFCYFIARIEDELKEVNVAQELIIYIDDPISSLDGNHIFFMFSLIDTIIAKQRKFKQLFISTHNLDFLKYLKRISAEDSSINHYLIERSSRQNEKRSSILIMPSHLKDFVTEFNYLFGEIYKACKPVSGNREQQVTNTYNQFYNLPNNIRKFLECYLFYKYPNNADPLKNLDKMFGHNVPSLINRVVNEYSHLTYLDRGWKPIDVAEAEECARLILEKVKEKDLEQYESLVDSLS